MALNPNRSLGFRQTACLCREVFSSLARRRSGLRRGRAGEKRPTEAGRMTEEPLKVRKKHVKRFSGRFGLKMAKGGAEWHPACLLVSLFNGTVTHLYAVDSERARSPQCAGSLPASFPHGFLCMELLSLICCFSCYCLHCFGYCPAPFPLLFSWQLAQFAVQVGCAFGLSTGGRVREKQKQAPSNKFVFLF